MNSETNEKNVKKINGRKGGGGGKKYYSAQCAYILVFVLDMVTMLWYQDPLLEAIYLIHHPLAIMMCIYYPVRF